MIKWLHIKVIIVVSEINIILEITNKYKQMIALNPIKPSTLQVINQSMGFSTCCTETLALQGEVFWDLDLPSKPLQDPLLAISYLLIKMMIVILGEYVHIQILKFLNHETCIVKEILTAFLYVQMVYWPVKVIFETTTDFMYPLCSMIGEWYCHCGFLWLVFGMTLIVFHSFIVGLMRYSFVVHYGKTAWYGIEEAKNLFYWISILVPLVMTLWGFMGRRQISSIASLNKCYGSHVEAFLLEEDVQTTTLKSFCAFENYEDDNNTVATLKKTLCIFHSLVYLLMGANVVEGFFYWRTVKFSNK